MTVLYIVSMDTERYFLEISRDSRPSPSPRSICVELCVESKVAIQLIAGREKAWN